MTIWAYFLKFTHPTCIVDTASGGIIYYNILPTQYVMWSPYAFWSKNCEVVENIKKDGTKVGIFILFFHIVRTIFGTLNNNLTQLVLDCLSTYTTLLDRMDHVCILYMYAHVSCITKCKIQYANNYGKS
jgi:hypothetical protein